MSISIYDASGIKVGHANAFTSKQTRSQQTISYIGTASSYAVPTPTTSVTLTQVVLQQHLNPLTVPYKIIVKGVTDTFFELHMKGCYVVSAKGCCTVANMVLYEEMELQVAWTQYIEEPVIDVFARGGFKAK